MVTSPTLALIVVISIMFGYGIGVIFGTHFAAKRTAQTIRGVISHITVPSSKEE